jgi:hypothetical protein
MADTKIVKIPILSVQKIGSRFSLQKPWIGKEYISSNGESSGIYNSLAWE